MENGEWRMACERAPQEIDGGQREGGEVDVADRRPAVHQRPEGGRQRQRCDDGGPAPKQTVGQGIGQGDGERAKDDGEQVPAQHVEPQQRVHASVQIVVQWLVPGGPGKVEREAARQHFTRERVDVDQFVVAPSRRDRLEATETQAPRKQEQDNDQ